MGFPVFSNVYAGILPTIIINIAVFFTSLRHTFNVFLKVFGCPRQPSSMHYNASHILFPEEYEPSAGLGVFDFSDKVVRALPLTVYNPKSMNLGTYTECPVCLSEFQKGQEIRLLPACKHTYHRHCLDKWLGYQHTTCPLCRASFVPEDITKRQQRRDLPLSEDIIFWFSSYSGAGFPSLWRYT